MLTREQCEALATLYPEVRSHGMVYGDAYFDGPALRVWFNAYTVLPSPDELSGGIVSHTPGEHLWCPRLDQLLDLARRVAARRIDDWPRRRRLCEGELQLFCDRWLFTPGMYPSAAADWGLGDGETPEAAVWGWLVKPAPLPGTLTRMIGT